MTDVIILAGNPNVGKSTLFNRLTGLRQHTGNWAGKTVGNASGYLEHKGKKKLIIDTPGTYSLNATSADETAARECICGVDCDALIVVCDACCLERGLFLALQIMQQRSNIIICINLIDEARRLGIDIDFETLSHMLKTPVVGISAVNDEGINELLDTLTCFGSESSNKLCTTENSAVELKKAANELCAKVVKYRSTQHKIHCLDRLLTHRFWAWPCMLLMLFAILWISIVGANYPSGLLSRLFAFASDILRNLLFRLAIPNTLISLLVDGIYGTTAWVISVMLPPMAIFFPLFTLLEDLGLLPRIAFNMDRIFGKCGSCGKQALTMCMGLGCNAVGVSGCRIISGKRERIISILTNSFMPCNGRFPTIILLASLLFVGKGGVYAAAVVLIMIMLGAALSFATAKIISVFFGKNKSAAFTLELPPYRKPKIIETLVRSLIDRTAIVLLRAIKAAAPAGLLIWLFANLNVDDRSILAHFRMFLEPIGEFFGMDGAILLGFILGFPANEIVMPIIIMCYLSGTTLNALPALSELSIVFADMGWTTSTILCIMVFTLLHWPCATTLMTIAKECGKFRFALLAAALPTAWGLLLCFLIEQLNKLL